MACVATWSFGLQAVLRAQASIEDGKNCVDVLESAINGIIFNFNIQVYMIRTFPSSC